jgi:hypothetical protein
MDKERRKSTYPFQLNQAVSFALLFLISFITSFQLIDLGKITSVNEIEYLFSENLLWIEEEDYISAVSDDSFDLDYVNYFKNEIDYFSSSIYIDEVELLSKSDYEEIYENIKNKKIL